MQKESTVLKQAPNFTAIHHSDASITMTIRNKDGIFDKSVIVNQDGIVSGTHEDKGTLIETINQIHNFQFLKRHPRGYVVVKYDLLFIHGGPATYDQFLEAYTNMLIYYYAGGGTCDTNAK